MNLKIGKKGQAAGAANPPPDSSPNLPPKHSEAPSEKQSKKAEKKAEKKAQGLAYRLRTRYVCDVAGCGQRFPSKFALDNHKITAHGYSADLIKLEEEKRNNRRIFNGNGRIVRSFKLHFIYVLPFIAILILVVIYFIFYATTNVGIVYLEVTYGTIFSKIGGLLSSGVSAITTFIAEMQNPNLLISQPQVTSTNATPTFSSFLILSSPSDQLVVLTTNPQQATILYSVQNNGNVPLGPGTPNNLQVSISCGSTVSSGAATYCRDMLTKFITPTQTSSSPPSIENASLLGILPPGSSIENETVFDLSCPSQKLTFPLSQKLTFPLSASLLATFIIKNYTAALILPIKFVSNSFYSQILSLSLSLIPPTPLSDFYSSGPLQIEVEVEGYTSTSRPLRTKMSHVPLEVILKNNGNSPYFINNISLFISKQFYPSNPSNSYWDCVNAQAMDRQGFQFPGTGYWNCYIDNSRILSSGSDFYLDLPAVNSLNGLHFNTMTIIGYVNYNYNESLNIPFTVSNQTCT